MAYTVKYNINNSVKEKIIRYSELASINNFSIVKRAMYVKLFLKYDKIDDVSVNDIIKILEISRLENKKVNIVENLII